MPLFSPQPSRRRASASPGPGSRRGPAGFGAPSRAGAAPGPVAPPPAAGTAASQLLRRYRPLETRAAGGFGSVEICLDSRLQRRVAIKRMPLASPYNRTAAETTATALAEARTASMLQHPNIVSVIDFTYDAAYAYLVMEYVDGLSLQEFLEQVDGSSLTYDEAACVADALIQALAYAHENGVLHLDIKPANVLIDRSGHVKLTDFGMAVLASSAGFGGARGGTVGYMPPEQLEGREVDERTDIFSLAAVLYESLCGTAPFRAGSPADSLDRIRKGVLYPSDLLPDIPELAEDSLLCALDPEPAGRERSAADFGARFLEGLGSPREGRRSLAQMIARLTSDDESDIEAEDGSGGMGAHRVWELDPGEGYLGSRSPRARAAAIGAVTGLSAATVTWTVLAGMQVAGAPGRAAAALAVGAAAAAAPQIGSALAVAGVLALILSATPLVGAFVPVVAVFAVTASWWLVWGRTQAGASAVFTAVAALACATGDAAALAPLAAALAAYLLPPGAAAAATALGVLFARLALAACAAGGLLPASAAAAALADPALLLSAAGLAGLAAAASRILEIAWDRLRDGRGTGLAALACALPPVVVLLLLCLANPMEIASLPTSRVATAAIVGCLSSILIQICVRSLGYRKDRPEGDRS